MAVTECETQKKMSIEDANILLADLWGSLYCVLSNKQIPELLALKHDLISHLRDPAVPGYVKDDIGQRMLPEINTTLDEMSETKASELVSSFHRTITWAESLCHNNDPPEKNRRNLEEAFAYCRDILAKLSKEGKHLWHALGRLEGGDTGRDALLQSLRMEFDESSAHEVIRDINGHMASVKQKAKKRHEANKKMRAAMNRCRAAGEKPTEENIKRFMVSEKGKKDRKKKKGSGNEPKKNKKGKRGK